MVHCSAAGRRTTVCARRKPRTHQPGGPTTVRLRPRKRGRRSASFPATPLLRIGYAALADAAPLLVAEELGFFARQRVRVSLSEEGAWAALRDKLILGAIDGAHLLGPMPIALACGLGGIAARLSVG